MSSRTPKNASETSNQRGMELADRGWFEEALREFGRAIDQDRNSPFPRINRASVLIEQGRDIEALEDILAALKLAPDNALIHYHLGVFLARGGTQLAKRELQKSLELDPLGLDAHIQLGRTQAELGEYNEAKRTLEHALSLEPADPLALHELGILHLDHGQVHAGIAVLKQANTLAPEEVEIAIDLGIAYLQAGFFDQSSGILLSVLGRDPANLYAWYNLAALHWQRGQTDEALKCMKKALQKDASLVRNWLVTDKMFEGLSADPGYAELGLGGDEST